MVGGGSVDWDWVGWRERVVVLVGDEVRISMSEALEGDVARFVSSSSSSSASSPSSSSASSEEGVNVGARAGADFRRDVGLGFFDMDVVFAGPLVGRGGLNAVDAFRLLVCGYVGCILFSRNWCVGKEIDQYQNV